MIFQMTKKLAIVLAFAAAVICGALRFVPVAQAQQAAPRTEQAYARGLLWKVELRLAGRGYRVSRVY